MKREAMPTWQELEEHAKAVPEIDPAAVIAMLEIRQAAEGIQEAILNVLRDRYRLSEGKFCVLIVLHQHPEGLAPSALAERVGVARATVSAMLQRLERDGLAEIASDAKDGRGKQVSLTEKGRQFMGEVLPGHYRRISKLMGKLTEKEHKELIRLLHKLSG